MSLLSGLLHVHWRGAYCQLPTRSIVPDSQLQSAGLSAPEAPLLGLLAQEPTIQSP